MYDNMDLNLIRTDGRTFLDDLGPLFFHLERYFNNTSNLVWIEAILKEARRQGARVLLDGGQGNMTFSQGGNALLSQLLKAGKLVQALAQANLIARRGGARSTLSALIGQGLVPFLPSPLWRALAWLRGDPSAFASHPWRRWSPINPEFAAAHRVEERARDWGHDFVFRPAPDCREQLYKALMRQDLGIFSTPYRAMYGVDSRTPPADIRIAEFCLALPEEQFLYQGETRSLIRRAMAGRLPPEVLSNKKRGQQAADGFERLSGLRATLPAQLDRLEQCDLARRALDLARLRGMVGRWPWDGSENREIPFQFQIVLERGLMVGRFLRWFETGE
jgi:asparagine synthase (glutamine-hydrolysing)